VRRAKVGILLVLAVLVAAGLYVRWRAGEAGKVRRVVESMRRAGEAKNEARFMSYISPSYHDRLGMTYERVAKVVEILARGPENYRVKVSGFRVSVKPKSAVASMNVSVTMDKEKPASARLIAEFRKEDGRWLLISSSGWQGFFEEGPPSGRGAAI